MGFDPNFSANVGKPEMKGIIIICTNIKKHHVLHHCIIYFQILKANLVGNHQISWLVATLQKKHISNPYTPEV